MRNGPSVQEEVGNFLGRFMYSGMHAHNDIEAVQVYTIASVDPNVQVDVFFSAASKYVVRTAENLASNDIQKLQQNSGRRTKFKLPDSGPFNTHHITSNSHAHSENNHIPIDGSNPSKVARGMIDNLYPNYSTIGPQFQASELNPTNLANLIPHLGSNLFNTHAPTSTVLAQSTDFQSDSCSSFIRYYCYNYCSD